MKATTSTPFTLFRLEYRRLADRQIAVQDLEHERLRAAAKGWQEAQTQFEATFGGEQSAALRANLHAISARDLGVGDAGEIDL